MVAFETQGALWEELPRHIPASRDENPRRAPGRPRSQPPPELSVVLANPETVLFLDVETTGLSHHYDEITLVGFMVGGVYAVHVKGDDPSALREALRSATAIVTFNGKVFDVPFLRRTFEELTIPACHLDLRYAARRAGLTGGQKAIEKRLLLDLRAGQDADGAAAVLIWHRYLRGELEALRELIEYNAADVRGMTGILDHIVETLEPTCDLLAARRSFLSLYRGSRGWASRGAELPAPSRVARKARRYDELFAGRAADAVVVGIDLTGSEAKPSGFAVLSDREASTAMIGSDDDLVAAVLAASPALVSIDSPLSLPAGRVTVGDDDPGRARYGIMRVCERTLKRRGINVYPCLLPSMQKLTARGIRLAERLRSLGIPVIESYPGAAQDIMGIPRKGAGERWLKLGLEEFGLSGPFTTEPVRHDELDAITSALVGTFFLAGKYEALGGPGENALIVPDLDARRSRLVVGLSGRISAGKTTAARLLEARGYAYVRFSMVIDDEIVARELTLDRATRQSVGLEIHETKGQRWLCERVLDRLGEAPHVVIDGLRWPEDGTFFAERFGGAFLHAHLEADVAVRKARYKSDAPSGRSFCEADAQPVEGGVEDLGRAAFVVITNESTVERLDNALDAAIEAFVGGNEPCLSQSS